MTEQLADDERECLLAVAGIDTGDGVAEKALRVIDAHAADRAALVAQLEAAKERYGWLLKRARCDGFVTVSELSEELEAIAASPQIPAPADTTHAALESEVTRLTRERDEALQRCEALDETSAGAQHARDEARADVTRLTEALAAAERFSKDAAERHTRDSSAYEARVRELTDTVTCNQRAADREHKRRVAADAECAALRAEVERLRDDHAEMRAERDNAWDRRDEEIAENRAAESRLAAATELLRECQLWMPPMRKCGVRAKLDAFVAAQPAAPCDTCEDAGLQLCPCTEGENGRGEPCRLPRRHDGVCRFHGQPAAPARTEACDHGDNPCSERDSFCGNSIGAKQLAKERTEAKQAVLDAFRAVPWADLWQQWESQDVWPNDALVELARRGLT